MSLSLTLLTACRNARDTILRTCRSVDAQLVGERVGIEHIILDGASDDRTIDRIAEYESHRHSCGAASNVQRILLCEPDAGPYDALNRGLKVAQADVIGTLNADDFLARENVVSHILSTLSTNTTAGVYGDLIYVKRKNESLVQHRYWRAGDYGPKALRAGWMPPHPTLYLRKKLYDRVGCFRTDLGSAADYEFMLRLMQLPDLALSYLPEVLVCMETGGLSNRSIGARWAAHRMDWRAWKENKLSFGFLSLPLKPLRKVSQFWRRHKSFALPVWAD